MELGTAPSKTEDKFTQVAPIKDDSCQTGHSCFSKACEEQGMKVSINLSPVPLTPSQQVSSHNLAKANR